MSLRLPVAILLPAAAAAAASAEAWSVSQRLELVTNATDEELVLEAIDFGYLTLGFRSSVPSYTVSILDVLTLTEDDELAANLSCSGPCQLWEAEFRGLAPDAIQAGFALQLTGWLAFYDDSDTPGFGQGPISTFILGPRSDVVPIEFVNFYGVTLSHLDMPSEEEVAETSSETQTRTSVTRSATLTTTPTTTTRSQSTTRSLSTTLATETAVTSMSSGAATSGNVELAQDGVVIPVSAVVGAAVLLVLACLSVGVLSLLLYRSKGALAERLASNRDVEGARSEARSETLSV